MAGSVAFKGFDFIRNGEINADLLNGQLFMLNERLDWMMSNLNASNFNRYFFDELTVRVAKGLNLEGVVTFKALAENEETVINGARIKTGVVEASEFVTYTDRYDTQTYGEIRMYYINGDEVTYENPYLAGGIKMDFAPKTTEAESQFRLWIYTDKIPNSNFKVSLKLESAYRASLEGKELVYIRSSRMTGSNASAKITLDSETIYLHANTVNNVQPTITLEAKFVQIKADAIIFNGEIIHEKE